MTSRTKPTTRNKQAPQHLTRDDGRRFSLVALAWVLLTFTVTVAYRHFTPRPAPAVASAHPVRHAARVASLR
jgi:hypothetical protein